MKDILVSVVCISYNQEKYIRQTLDGFVMQQTNFPFEVVISDDCSKDSTRQIIAEYKAKYPDLFRDVSPEKNMGSLTNFIHVQQEAKGKYIAFCEGDDYWVDPLKLQKQVDYMEAHPEYSICFHTIRVYNEKSKQFEDDTITREVAETTDIHELAKGNYIHTPSVIVRYNKEVLTKLRSLGAVLPGDYVQWMLYATNGKIYKMKEEMAVYRLGSGVWSTNKGIGNDLSMLITLTKLWAVMPEVREELWELIQNLKSSLIRDDNRQQAKNEELLQSNAYRIGRALLAPSRWIKGLRRK